MAQSGLLCGVLTQVEVMEDVVGVCVNSACSYGVLCGVLTQVEVMEDVVCVCVWV